MGIGGLSLVLKKASVAFGSVALANASFNNTTLHSGANALESSLDSSTAVNPSPLLESSLESSWQGAVAPFLWWGAYGFAVLAVVIFALLLVCYGAKMLYHFNAFKADLKHQVKMARGSRTISMVGGVWLCGVGSGYFRPFACVLWCENALSFQCI